MERTFLSGIPLGVIVLMLIIAMFISYLLAIRITSAVKKKNPLVDFSIMNRVRGGILGLLTLIMAFTFNLSLLRYEQRRDIIIQEANCIKNAINYSDLFADSVRTTFRKDFREYIAARILYFDDESDETGVNKALIETRIISYRIWKRAASASKDPDINSGNSNTMIQALAKMSDAVTTRDALRVANVPDSVVWLLSTLCITGIFLLGFGFQNNRISKFIVSLVVLILASTVFIILDIDRSRQGFVTNAVPHQKIIELQDMVSF
jgi:hypothetical protein